MANHISGLIAAPFTCFDSDGNLNLAMVERQQALYKKNGLSGAFICGSTGEAASMTAEEKKALYRAWAPWQEHTFRIIAFVGGTSTRECIDLAHAAAECGLGAIAMTAPYYQKPANVKVLAQCCAEVAAAEPELPFYYYHIPCLTGVHFPMYDLLQEMDPLIPNLAGIKYTYENMMDYQLCLNFKDRKYDLLWGRDEMLLEALAIGAQGAVGSTYNYSAPVYTALIDAFRSGRTAEAAELQQTANLFITLLGKYGGGCGKAFMRAIGLDTGPCRLPLTTLTEAQYEAFTDELARMPFEQYKSKL